MLFFSLRMHAPYSILFEAENMYQLQDAVVTPKCIYHRSIVMGIKEAMTT